MIYACSRSIYSFATFAFCDHTAAFVLRCRNVALRITRPAPFDLRNTRRGYTCRTTLRCRTVYMPFYTLLLPLPVTVTPVLRLRYRTLPSAFAPHVIRLRCSYRYTVCYALLPRTLPILLPLHSRTLLILPLLPVHALYGICVRCSPYVATVTRSLLLPFCRCAITYPPVLHVAVAVYRCVLIACHHVDFTFAVPALRYVTVGLVVTLNTTFTLLHAFTCVATFPCRCGSLLYPTRLRIYAVLPVYTAPAHFTCVADYWIVAVSCHFGALRSWFALRFYLCRLPRSLPF